MVEDRIRSLVRAYYGNKSQFATSEEEEAYRFLHWLVQSALVDIH
jgi:hypothetical protein